MDKTPYPVGTVCRIRSAEDMTNRYNIPFGFTDSMNYLCGQTFTVKTWRKGLNAIRYWSYEGIEGMWSISHEMLEVVDHVEDEDDNATADTMELGVLLFG